MSLSVRFSLPYDLIRFLVLTRFVLRTQVRSVNFSVPSGRRLMLMSVLYVPVSLRSFSQDTDPVSFCHVQPFEEKAKEDKTRYEKEKADYEASGDAPAKPEKKKAAPKKAKKVESEDEASEDAKVEDDDEDSE